jgi:hypothetical protein
MDTLTHLYLVFREQPEQLNVVMEEMTLIVGGSFLADGSKMTRNEVKRRLQMSAKWLLTLRQDVGWSVQRALDELPKALRSELDGIPYEPSREGRSTWSADNGRDLIWLPPTT